jgi:hypothetical protein
MISIYSLAHPRDGKSSLFRRLIKAAPLPPGLSFSSCNQNLCGGAIAKILLAS